MNVNADVSVCLDLCQANMGYQKGKGLGRYGEGRVDIVESSKQRGRRGLGHITEGFEASDDLVWEDAEEVISGRYMYQFAFNITENTVI